MSWVLLALAIVLEVAGTTNMKLSEGFTERVPSVLVFVFYGLSIGALTLSLKRIDVSVAYAVGHGVHRDGRGVCLRRGIDRGQGSRTGLHRGGGGNAQYSQPDALDEPSLCAQRRGIGIHRSWESREFSEVR